MERDVIESKAFCDLTGQSRLVLFLFFLKLQKRKSGPKGRERLVMLNNGELQFTFKEAKEKYHVSKGQFERALDQLCAFGFIAVAKIGNAARRQPTLYAVTEDWREYGEPEFVPKERPRDSRHMGFRGQLAGATAKRQKKQKKGLGGAAAAPSGTL